jgi:hypothetical protein
VFEAFWSSLGPSGVFFLLTGRGSPEPSILTFTTGSYIDGPMAFEAVTPTSSSALLAIGPIATLSLSRPTRAH